MKPNNEILARLRAQANFAAYIDKYFILNNTDWKVEEDNVYKFEQIIIRPLGDTGDFHPAAMQIRRIVYIPTSSKKNPIKPTSEVKEIDASSIKIILNSKEEALKFLKDKPIKKQWTSYDVYEVEDNYREKRERAVHNARSKKLWKK